MCAQNNFNKIYETLVVADETAAASLLNGHANVGRRHSRRVPRCTVAAEEREHGDQNRVDCAGGGRGGEAVTDASKVRPRGHDRPAAARFDGRNALWVVATAEPRRKVGRERAPACVALAVRRRSSGRPGKL